MDVEKINELITWIRKVDMKCVDFVSEFIEPVTEALGDDIDVILEYLTAMPLDDLRLISGCFEHIYGKFMTDDVYDALEELEKKIA